MHKGVAQVLKLELSPHSAFKSTTIENLPSWFIIASSDQTVVRYFLKMKNDIIEGGHSIFHWITSLKMLSHYNALPVQGLQHQARNLRVMSNIVNLLMLSLILGKIKEKTKVKPVLIAYVSSIESNETNLYVKIHF